MGHGRRPVAGRALQLRSPHSGRELRRRLAGEARRLCGGGGLVPGAEPTGGGTSVAVAVRDRPTKKRDGGGGLGPTEEEDTTWPRRKDLRLIRSTRRMHLPTMPAAAAITVGLGHSQAMPSRRSGRSYDEKWNCGDWRDRRLGPALSYSTCLGSVAASRR